MIQTQSLRTSDDKTQFGTKHRSVRNSYGSTHVLIPRYILSTRSKAYKVYMYIPLQLFAFYLTDCAIIWPEGGHKIHSNPLSSEKRDDAGFAMCSSFRLRTQTHNLIGKRGGGGEAIKETCSRKSPSVDALASAQ
jgi:hypothetical protein